MVHGDRRPREVGRVDHSGGWGVRLGDHRGGRGCRGCACAAPAAAPPRHPPPRFAPPLLQALLLWWRPPASSSAAAPDEGAAALSVRAVAAGSEAGGLGGSGQAHSRPQRARQDRGRRACWCETACGPSRAGCAAVIPRVSSSGSAPACSSRTGIVRLPARNEATGGGGLGRAGRAGRLARTELLVERVHHRDGRRFVRQAE